MGAEFTILIDQAEQAPLPIPKRLRVLDPTWPPTAPRTKIIEVVTREGVLGAADYGVPGAPLCLYTHQRSRGKPAGIIERKFSIDELSGNTLTSRRPAFISCLQNMRAAWGPRALLLLDGGWDALYRPTHISEDLACCARDAIQRLSLEYGVPIIPLGTRTPAQRARIGDWVARWLYNATLTGEAPCPTT